MGNVTSSLEKNGLFNRWYGDNWVVIFKMAKWIPCLSLNIKTNCKWDRYRTVEMNHTHTRCKLSEFLYNLGVGSLT